MALKSDGQLQMVSFALDKDLVKRVKAIQVLRSTRHDPKSFSAIMREVVEAGIPVIHRAPDTTFGSTINSSEEAA